MNEREKKMGEPTPEKPELGTVVERNKDHIVVEHRWREKIPIRPTATNEDIVCDDETSRSEEEDEETNDVSENEGDHESPEGDEEVDEED